MATDTLLGVRVSRDLKAELQARADSERRTLRAVVERILEQAVQQPAKIDCGEVRGA